MKKIFFILFLLSNLIYSQEHFVFEDLTNLTSKRGLISTTSNSKYLFASKGFTPDKPYSTEVEMYDIQNDKWTILSQFTIGKRFASLETIGNNLYLFNGLTSIFNGIDNNTLSNKIEKINLSSGNISILSNNPFPVRSAGSCIFNDELYFFGGSNRIGYSNKLMKYNLENDNWIELKEMPVAKETKGTVIDGKIYVFGGYNGSSGLKSIDSYDIRTDKWEHLLDLPTGVSAHSVVALNKKILIVGDYENLTKIGYYDIDNNSYVSCTSNMIGRRHFGAEIVNNKMYIIDGNQTPNSSSSLNSLQFTDLTSTLSILENKLSDFKIYPTPTSNILNIKSKINIEKLEIVNINGKVVLKLIKPVISKKIDIKELKNGVYFLNVSIGNSIITKKIVKIN
jgi:N-acetylneuraminic acid mutarotase